MADNFHHAPNIGAKSRSPNIRITVCDPGGRSWSPAHPVTDSPGQNKSIAVHLNDNVPLTRNYTHNNRERRLIVSAL